MGSDASMIVYAGEPLTLTRLAGVYGRALGGRVGSTRIAIRHAHDLMARNGDFGGPSQSLGPVHALATLRAVHREPSPAPRDRPLRSSTPDVSLSEVMRKAWTIAFGGFRGKTLREIAGEARELPEDALQSVCVELSRDAEVLFVSCADHSAVGGYDRYASGVRTQSCWSRLDVDDDYNEIANTGLADFVGMRGRDVTDPDFGPEFIEVFDLFWGSFDALEVPLHVVIDYGRAVDQPHRVTGEEQESYELIH
jgi:hypothetical protein